MPAQNGCWSNKPLTESHGTQITEQLIRPSVRPSPLKVEVPTDNLKY
jgi:hypothetical protein